MRISKAFGLAIGFACWAGAAGAEPGASPATVVAAEREFAADAQARGWITAFKKYAAIDAVVFQPDPVNAQASLADQPDEPADRSLKWWPVWAGIAVSGDLGFTTGPYTVGDKGFGHYFTVWAKQSDGTWRWVYDGGPRNEAKSPLGPDTEPAQLSMATTSSGSPGAAWSEVAAAEEALAKAAITNSKQAALAHLSDDARVMGSPSQPAATGETRSAELDRRAAAITFAPLGGRASKAGDMVFTYGDAKWTLDGEARRGHYVRIWQKRGERWLLVFDELLGVPPPKSKP
jgi:ketosteroid isomerase-like protein